LSENESKKLLIAPLDWGLGHTSRCVPIIRYLLQQGHMVCFAGNKWQRNYMCKCVGPIETIHLDGYNISYGNKPWALKFTILRQVPSIFKTIKQENKWLNELLSQRHFDAVISDNRYGLFNSKVPSYIICHQLQIISGAGSMVDMVLQKLHYKLLNKFQATWVPDVKATHSISGKLGHPNNLPLKCHFIGPLSAYSNMPANNRQSLPLLVILSGLEPYRQQLSNILWLQICSLGIKTVFIEGSNTAIPKANVPNHIQYHLQLSTTEIQPLMALANIVICRSGYSSIMDLIAMGKMAILIPTPGQTEQEYLANFHLKEGNFLSATQKGFQLSKFLQLAQNFNHAKNSSPIAFNTFQNVLKNYI